MAISTQTAAVASEGYTMINEDEEQERREREWREVEDLVMIYQRQFSTELCDTYAGSTTPAEIKKQSQQAMIELIERFSPLFKKYTQLLSTGQIDFDDMESKMFVMLFIDDKYLQGTLKRYVIAPQQKTDIAHKFNFVKENYGSIQHEEILTDLHVLFMTISRRYKQMGKSFCGYLYNAYRHEVARHIKKHIKNPINIKYKNVEYEDEINSSDFVVENNYEDHYYEDAMGMPDASWIQGSSCTDIFADLDPLERKIIVKYYLEFCNDRQISECFGIHINTINNSRRHATELIAQKLGIKPEDIKRSRRSGKKAILPQQ